MHRHGRWVRSLLLPFADGLASRVSWRVFVRAVIADDGLHRAYGERGAFLTADGERDGAQNHAILPRIEIAKLGCLALGICLAISYRFCPKQKGEVRARMANAEVSS